MSDRLTPADCREALGDGYESGKPFTLGDFIAAWEQDAADAARFRWLVDHSPSDLGEASDIRAAFDRVMARVPSLPTDSPASPTSETFEGSPELHQHLPPEKE
jgi:hypothetical protein